MIRNNIPNSPAKGRSAFKRDIKKFGIFHVKSTTEKDACALYCCPIFQVVRTKELSKKRIRSI